MNPCWHERSGGSRDRPGDPLSSGRRIKAWIRSSGAPISDAGGNIVGGVVLITDIDKEKSASEALRINQERLNLAQKASPAGSRMEHPDQRRNLV